MTHITFIDETPDLITRWITPPPEAGETFTVLRDEWDTESDPPVRTILEWEARP